MKRMIKISVAGVGLALCLLLTGCLGQGFLAELNALLQEEAPSSSAVLPAAADPPAAQSGQDLLPIPESVSEASSQPSPIRLNSDVIAFLGQPNAILKQANGTDCAAYIMYGGSPVADYMSKSVAYPFAFWLSADQESLMELWGEVSDGQGNGPQENFWPDEYTIGIIEAWGDSIGILFSTDGPVTYAMLAERYGQSPSLEFTAAYEGADYSYTVDIYSASYEIEGYTLDAVFTEEGSEYNLYTLRLW